MNQKFYCTVPSCTSNFTCRSTWRCHIKTVHKNLSPTEVQNYMEIISNTKPKFENGAINYTPRRGRQSKKC